MNEWISVEERLPEDVREVIAWFDYEEFSGGGNIFYRFYSLASYCGVTKCWLDENCEKIYDWPTHWMPLPEPPK